jgi:hypothetical protein
MVLGRYILVLGGQPLAGREATAPSIIREIEEIQGGEQVPRNGRLALPKDVAVKPFSLKGFFNTTLNVLISTLARRSNGLPGGHADLSSSLSGLE